MIKWKIPKNDGNGGEKAWGHSRDQGEMDRMYVYKQYTLFNALQTSISGLNSNRTVKWKHYYDVYYVLANKLAICLFWGYFNKDYKKFQYFVLSKDLPQYRYLFDNIYFSKKVKVGRIRIRPVP
jgi:hypothetical protein